MNENLLATLRAHFGTVSSRTETGGTVAVRNVTAYRKLAIMAEAQGATVAPRPTSWPALVRVTETAPMVPEQTACPLQTFGLPCSKTAGHAGPCSPTDNRPGKNW
jgi:hypothetical protein